MTEQIEEGFMAFVADGGEGIGAVRKVSGSSLIIYVENAGDFIVPRSAGPGVHSQKVMREPRRLARAFLAASGHAHDREDPSVAG